MASKTQFFTASVSCIKYLIIIVFLASCEQDKDAAITKIEQFIEQSAIDKSKANWKTSLKKPPLLEFSADRNYFWQLTTSEGELLLKLFPEYAPMHVSSTIYLTQLGFYDGLLFHRVIPGFMAQAGDPKGNGRGDPGYRYAGEYSDAAKHDKAGVLSTANSGPGTDGSQFFITFKATPHLNNRHSVFGQLVEGTDTLKAIEKLGSFNGKTRQPITIKSAKILIRKKTNKKKVK